MMLNVFQVKNREWKVFCIYHDTLQLSLCLYICVRPCIYKERSARFWFNVDYMMVYRLIIREARNSGFAFSVLLHVEIIIIAIDKAF